MTRKDFIVFGLWALFPLALLAPSWLLASAALHSFGDLYAYHYPLRHLAASSLQSGHIPFWNAYTFAGLPLSANSQSVLFYPVSVLGRIFPLSLSFSWDYAFHILWAGLGAYLLARSQRLKRVPALFLATLFALSPFLIYRITAGIPTLLASLSWIPWCWLAWLSRRPGMLAGCWALQFFSGHPQFMVINAAGMVLWGLSRGAWRPLKRFCAEGAAVLALTAVQWLPTFEFMKHSLRSSWPTSFGTAYSVGLTELGMWLSPNIVGNPISGTYDGYPSVFFETGGLYLGLAGILLALLGLWRARSWAAFVLLGAGLFLAAGGHNPLFRDALESSVLGYLRTPARYLLLCLLGAFIAAGSGVWLLERRYPLLAGLALIALLLELGMWNVPFLRTEGSAPYLGVNANVAETVGGRPLRFMTDPELASPNKALLYRAMNINGYDAFYLGSFPLYAARSEGKPAADPSRSYLRRYDSPEMNRAGVAYFLGADGRLIENPKALPLAYFAGPRGVFRGEYPELRIPRPERWSVRGKVPEGADRVVLAQAFYPGWRAWLAGKKIPVKVEDGFLQSVSLPGGSEGTVDLVLKFVPTGWPLWVLVSVLAWLFWLGRMSAGFVHEARSA